MSLDLNKEDKSAKLNKNWNEYSSKWQKLEVEKLKSGEN